ncbi:MAG: FtsX-like permease family protein [Saprospiraceae bacterium]|nr:FtsX-like permease family protein [Saprospiraceae bacterium]
MIQNYLKLALRNLGKNRLFAGLNILGLALSMSVGLLVLLLFRDAYRYDQFHPARERIYRINTEALRKDGDSERYASTPFPVGEALAEGFTQTEEMTRLRRDFNGEARSNGKLLPLEGLYADPAFFHVFGFSLQEGNVATALTQPMTVVLTQETADRFFPRESAIGKTLEISGYGAFQVTGVLNKFPGKTHLEFEALASASSIPALEQSGSISNASNNWTNYYGTHTFVRLREGASAAEAEEALTAIAKTAYDGKVLESRDAGYRFYLHPLSEITPGPNLSNDMGRGLPEFLLWLLAILSGVIMLSACFNYTNLTLARALTRAREIGVRKVMGATRRQLVGQLLGEGVLTALLALGLGWGLMKLIQPGFNSLSFTESTDLSIQEDTFSVLLFLVFAVTVGLIAGALPALAISRISPVSVLQKLENLRFFKHMGLRKTLLVAQFAVTLVFIVLVTVISQQISYLMHLGYGFNSAQILNVPLQGQSPDKVIPAFSAVPGVMRISCVSHNMGTWEDSSSDIRCAPDAEQEAVRDYFVDQHFVENMGLEFVAGGNFPANAQPNRESFLVVNEKFVDHFKLGSPVEAVGKQITIGDSTQVRVCGVLKDFIFKPASYELEPMMLRNNPAQWQILQVKIAAGDPVPTLTALNRAWSSVVPERPMESEFYDQTLRENWAALQDILAIISVFAFLGIFIASLGLLGMATYQVETRMKEVGLRKVLGASGRDLVLLLSRRFMILLGIAVVIATPLGWLLGGQFLQMFAHHFEMGPGVLLPGILLLLGVSALTIGSQTYRATRSNPVDSLRNE